MSDFDKEAEREKLREKYEKDQQRRETTEKMSELLLQGATMTNNHCADCGDPIFRYDGQEFCPTCERPVDSGGAEADDGSDDGQETIGVTEPRDDARVQFGGADADHAAQAAGSQSTDHSRQPVDDRGSDQQRRDRQQATENPQQSVQSDEGQPQQSPRDQQQSPRDQQQSASQPRSIPSSDPARGPADSTANAAGTVDVTTARDSLVRTLAKFSQQAEATDDPQRAQESLAAAREAAEALAALRR